MAQVLALSGLVLVPIGIAWLIFNWTRRLGSQAAASTGHYLQPDTDLLRTRPLRGSGGHYAVHDASSPHWKYFWFD
jgi:hypothetical protein